MIAQIHEGERIVPKAFNPTIGGANNDERMKELIEQVKALREELEVGNYAIARNTLKTAQWIEKWEKTGLPKETVL
jgi:hypothetical protein